MRRIRESDTVECESASSGGWQRRRGGEGQPAAPPAPAPFEIHCDEGFDEENAAGGGGEDAYRSQSVRLQLSGRSAQESKQIALLQENPLSRFAADGAPPAHDLFTSDAAPAPPPAARANENSKPLTNQQPTTTTTTTTVQPSSTAAVKGGQRCLLRSYAHAPWIRTAKEEEVVKASSSIPPHPSFVSTDLHSNRQYRGCTT